MYPVHVIEQNCSRSLANIESLRAKQKQETETKMDTKLMSINTLTKK